MFTAYKVNHEVGTNISVLISDLHTRIGRFPDEPDLHINIMLAVYGTTSAIINAIYNHVYFHPIINHE